MEILQLPKLKKDRIINTKYIYKEEIRIWDGKGLRCKHNREKKNCIDCDGSQICIHRRRRRECKECGGSRFCKHGKFYYLCNECGGDGLCYNCKYTRYVKRYVSEEDKYVKLCADCFYKLYPNEKKVPTKYKRKQHYINDKIIEEFGKNYFNYDITIDNSCSRRIPDWFKDYFTHILNFECDENQHKDRNSSCESKRLCELFVDCANRPFICIRFNPDRYININGDRIEGCFEFDEKNNIILNEKEFNRRWEIVINTITFYIENGTKKEIETIYLYYDNFD